MSTAQHALADCARVYAEDLVGDVLLDVERGRFERLPANCRDTPRFIDGVIRHRARHVNRREMRVVSISREVFAPVVCEAWACAAQICLAKDVAAALARLTPRQEQIARMHWLNQWSEPEIATALGISACTVKELLRRAAFQLRCHLACYANLESCAARASAATGITRSTISTIQGTTNDGSLSSVTSLNPGRLAVPRDAAVGNNTTP